LLSACRPPRPVRNSKFEPQPGGGRSFLAYFVVVGGQTGIAGHLEIGARARIAAQSGVMRDVPAGASVGGSPAQDLRAFLQHAARARRPRRGSDRELKT